MATRTGWLAEEVNGRSAIELDKGLTRAQRRRPSDAHHLKFAQPRALGRKVSDEFAVPLCRVHHREVHRSSHEIEWWERYGLTPLPIALALWTQTHAVELTPSEDRTEPAPTAELRNPYTMAQSG